MSIQEATGGGRSARRWRNFNDNSFVNTQEATPQQKAKAARNICGSPHIRDAADAATIMEVLGLIERNDNA